MKFIAIGDTHCFHNNIIIPPDIDLIISVGDISQHGTASEIYAFIAWLKNCPVKHKIVIAGNHDLCLEEKNFDWKIQFSQNGISYLLNEMIEINGIKIYGSPYIPESGNFAFQRNRDELDLIWQQVPKSCDLLITHGPPHGILDLLNNQHMGDMSLYQRVQHILPRYHIFGHIHRAYGKVETMVTTFLNVSCKHFLTKGKFTPPIWEI